MDFKIRLLKRGDLNQDFIRTLSSLDWNIFNTSLDTLHDAQTARELSSKLLKTYVAVDNENKIVGTASLILEPKFIHDGGGVAHIEDVSVSDFSQGCGVGTALIQHCIEVANINDCYKIILSCSSENVRFYERCGFRQHQVSMRLDLHN